MKETTSISLINSMYQMIEKQLNFIWCHTNSYRHTTYGHYKWQRTERVPKDGIHDISKKLQIVTHYQNQSKSQYLFRLALLPANTTVANGTVVSVVMGQSMRFGSTYSISNMASVIMLGNQTKWIIVIGDDSVKQTESLPF